MWQLTWVVAAVAVLSSVYLCLLYHERSIQLVPIVGQVSLFNSCCGVLLCAWPGEARAGRVGEA